MPWFPGRWLLRYRRCASMSCTWALSEAKIKHEPSYQICAALVKSLPNTEGEKSFQATILTTAGSDTPSQSPGCSDNDEGSALQLEAVIDTGCYNLEMPEPCLQLVISGNLKQQATFIWINSFLVDFPAAAVIRKTQRAWILICAGSKSFRQSADASESTRHIFSSPEHM